MSILPLLPILSICEKPDWAHFLETDSRKAWMVVVSSHQYLPAWNRTEQNLKFFALIDMKLEYISFRRNVNFDDRTITATKNTQRQF